ncbi:hypothetical protein GCM10022275_13160 [Tessaracoccus defluvii]
MSVLVTGQIDHAGELFRAPPTKPDRFGRDMMPNVFVDAQRADTGETVLVIGSSLKDRPDGPP